MKAVLPRGTSRNFQLNVPRQGFFHELPMVIAVEGTYEDESGQVALYDFQREIKVVIRALKTGGVQRLLEYQERCYGDLLQRLNSLRPQPATGLPWTPIPFVSEVGEDFVDIKIKFKPTMQVRVIDVNDRSVVSTKPLFQVMAGERIISPFTIGAPWAMDERGSDREGKPYPPIFGMTCKSSSGTGGDTEEERSRGMVTILQGVEDVAAAADAGEGVDDAAQPSAPKRRKGVQSDLGDLA